MSSRVYFAHPVNTYDTPFEKAVETLIKSFLPDHTIESPNQPHHQENYAKWQKETAENRDVHNAMQYFFKVVQPQCDGCIALPFLDGKFGLGVAGEVARDAGAKKPVWLIDPTFFATKIDFDGFVKNPSDSRLFRIHLATADELDFIRREVTEHQARIKTSEEYEDAERVLSHQETRLRTFYVYGREKRPYEEAHLVSMPIPEGFYPDDK